MKNTYLPINMEETQCSETSAYKTQTPGNYPEESIQQTEDCLVRMEKHCGIRKTSAKIIIYFRCPF